MFNAFRKPSRFDFAIVDIQGGPTRISNAALKHLRNNIYNMLNTNLAPKFSGLSLQAPIYKFHRLLISAFDMDVCMSPVLL